MASLRSFSLVTGAVAAVAVGVLAAPGAQAAPAGSLEVGYTMDGNTNVRSGPHTTDSILGVMSPGKGHIYIFCYARGDYVNDGTYHTSVWYRGSITDSAGRGWSQSWVWAGRVDTPSDPAPNVPHC